MATSTSLAQLARRMRDIAGTFENNTERTIRRAAVAALQTAVVATPVKSGRARGNWRVGVGGPVLTGNDETFDKDGGPTISDGQFVIDEFRIGHGTIYLSNNVNYIRPLDEGSSVQAPNGMSEMAIQSALHILRNDRLLRGV